MKTSTIRRLATLGALASSFVMFVAPARAETLFTFGEMTRLQSLPLQAAERPLSEEDAALYQSFEFYAYTVFESLQVANDAARLINHEPLFCAPSTVFRFRQEDDIARLARQVTAQLTTLIGAAGGALEGYDDQPASAVLLLGLRAAFPCPDQGSQLVQR